MSEQPIEDQPTAEEEHSPGIAELSTLSRLRSDWKPISIQQLGPDGTEVLGMVLFYACPICSAVVAPPIEGNEFPREHAGFHIQQARDFDVLNTLLREAAEATS